jgi:hypothetical protein
MEAAREGSGVCSRRAGGSPSGSGAPSVPPLVEEQGFALAEHAQPKIDALLEQPIQPIPAAEL